MAIHVVVKPHSAVHNLWTRKGQTFGSLHGAKFVKKGAVYEAIGEIPDLEALRRHGDVIVEVVGKKHVEKNLPQVDEKRHVPEQIVEQSAFLGAMETAEPMEKTQQTEAVEKVTEIESAPSVPKDEIDEIFESLDAEAKTEVAPTAPRPRGRPKKVW